MSEESLLTEIDDAEFFRKLVEHTNDVVTIADQNAQIIYNNPALERLLGHPPDSLTGRSIIEYLHPDDVEHVSAAIGNLVYGTTQIEETEFRFRHIDGTYRRFQGVSRRWHHNGTSGILANSRDISAQHAAIENLAHTNELISKTFDASNNYLSISDLETGKIVNVNDAWVRAMGYSREEAIGSTAKELGVWGSTENRQSVLNAMSERGNLRGHEAFVYSKDGTQRAVLVDVRTLHVGDSTQILVSSQDVTETKQIEEELRQSQKMEAIGQLTGGVAHDFNNLIGITMGNAELLLSQLPADSHERRYAQQILDASVRAANLTQQLLAFSRRQPLQPVPISFLAQLQAMTPLLQTTLTENTKIVISDASGVTACSVDQGQFEAAILNLALNAHDAMPNGGAVYFALSKINLDGNAFVQLDVTDTGVGMSPHALEHAFEPFFTTKDQGKGTGLGLAMVFGFVKQSGGGIYLTSTPGGGTTVTLRFPEVEPPVNATTTKPPEVPTITSNAAQIALVVEDNEPLRILVAEYLNDLGYQVLEADSEDSTQTVLAEIAHLDLLVSDILLNGPSTGVQIAAQLNKRYDNLQVVLMTGFADREPTDIADELIRKPFSRKQFIETVQRASSAASQPLRK